MRKRILITAFLCAGLLSSLTACASDKEVVSETQSTELEIDVKSDVASVSGIDETDSENDTASTTEAETETSADVPTTPLISAEEAQKIADSGMEYIHTNNALEIIQDTTYGECLKAFIHSPEAEELGLTESDDDLVAWLETTWANDKYYHDMRACYPFYLYTIKPVQDDRIITDDIDTDTTAKEQETIIDFFDFKCVNPVPMTDVEVDNINNIIQYMLDYYADENEPAIDFPKIIDGYVFDIQRSNGDETDFSRMFVVRTTASDGKYKLDLFYAPYSQASMSFIALGEAMTQGEENNN